MVFKKSYKSFIVFYGKNIVLLDSLKKKMSLSKSLFKNVGSRFLGTYVSCITPASTPKTCF